MLAVRVPLGGTAAAFLHPLHGRLIAPCPGPGSDCWSQESELGAGSPWGTRLGQGWGCAKGRGAAQVEVPKMLGAAWALAM